jgi:hypothetical protein
VDLVLIYLGSGIVGAWGIAHLVATPWTIPTLGDLDTDARRVVTMEWLAEGTALVSVAALVSAATFVGAGSPAADAVSVVAIVTLVAMAVTSIFTGARVPHIAYRLCPPIFLLSALLVGLGSWIV